MIHLLGNNRIYAIIAGGVFMLVAAAMMQRVKDPRTLSVQDV
jgi:maltose/moltooligosaccharide transporter